MKTVTFITWLLLPTMLPAQETVAPDALLPSTDAPPDRVTKAQITSRRIVRPASQKVGALIIEEIEPPPPSIPLPATPLPPAAKQGKPRPQGEVTEIQLFSPKVIVYGNGLSMVRWWSNEGSPGSQEYSAWVTRDLSSITSCGDLNVGRRRYLLMPMVIQGKEPITGLSQLPSPAAFKDPGDILLTKGDIANQKALEPLQALLDKYDSETVEIRAAAAANMAAQKEREWQELHAKAQPQKARDSVIKHWVIRTNVPSQAAKQPMPVGPPQERSQRREFPSR